MIYDAIVIGIGSMGSSALYHMSRRHMNVLGLEQFYVTHDRGSHFGQSRLIRKAYFEHPDYVPLLKRSYSLWGRLEKRTREKLYHQTGIVYFGKPKDPILEGIRKSAKLHDIKLVELSHQECSQKYPMFKLPRNFVGLFEPEAGFVLPEKTIEGMVNLACDRGAEIRTEEKVVGWQLKDDLVHVETESNHYKGKRLVITAGPFVKDLLPSLPVQLNPTRQHLVWFETESPFKLDVGEFPCWVIADGKNPGIFYGFPEMNDVNGGLKGMKVGRHVPGEVVDPHILPSHESQEKEEESLAKFLKEWMPGVEIKPHYTSNCLYTMSPDEHFVIDRHPKHRQVVYACGFSGHGFKFSPVIGQILSDLTIDGFTELPIGFLSSYRF